MQPIQFEPTYRCLLHPRRALHLYLIGCGGTGSHVAQAIGATLWHLKRRGDMEIQTTFIDGDLVEAQNVGRQRFCAAEIGRNKAATLAGRLNAAYGLDIATLPAFLTGERCRRLFASSHRHDSADGRLLIGCVDNAIARQVIAEVIDDYHGRIWWLDCGNAAHNGQVLIGNCGRRTPIYPPNPDMGLWHDLPAPHVQEPGLLDADNDPKPTATCAVAVQTQEQSLMVNTLAASIAAQYLYAWAVRRELPSYATYFNGQPPVMTSRRLTRNNLMPFAPVENEAEEVTT